MTPCPGEAFSGRGRAGGPPQAALGRGMGPSAVVTPSLRNGQEGNPHSFWDLRRLSFVPRGRGQGTQLPERRLPALVGPLWVSGATPMFIPLFAQDPGGSMLAATPDDPACQGDTH